MTTAAIGRVAPNAHTHFAPLPRQGAPLISKLGDRPASRQARYSSALPRPILEPGGAGTWTIGRRSGKLRKRLAGYLAEVAQPSATAALTAWSSCRSARWSLTRCPHPRLPHKRPPTKTACTRSALPQSRKRLNAASNVMWNYPQTLQVMFGLVCNMPAHLLRPGRGDAYASHTRHMALSMRCCTACEPARCAMRLRRLLKIAQRSSPRPQGRKDAPPLMMRLPLAQPYKSSRLSLLQAILCQHLPQQNESHRLPAAIPQNQPSLGCVARSLSGCSKIAQTNSCKTPQHASAFTAFKSNDYSSVAQVIGDPS